MVLVAGYTGIVKFIDVVHFTVNGFKTWHGYAKVCLSKVTIVSHIVSVFS